VGERVGGRVLVCGLATLDVVQTVERVPTANEKVVAAGLAVAAGGPAANAAVTCAALGVPVRLVTRIGGGAIGGGALGGVVREDLVRAGVEVVDLAGPEASPPVSTVLVTRATGERAVVSVNATVGPAESAEVPGEVWDGVGLVLVDGHHLDLGVTVATEARRRGVPVLLDGGSWKPGLEALLARVDVAVVSADFAVPAELGMAGRRRGEGPAQGPDQGRGEGRSEGRSEALGDDVLDAVLRLGPRFAARSAGGGPIAVAAAGERRSVAVPGVTVVDTLGAGDVLHGALAAWLAAHRTATEGPAAGLPDVVAALTWAAGVASASCAAAGARGWTSDASFLQRLREELARVAGRP
jgi:sugar/nucleoside kinase (ribokinase family)